MTTAFIGPKRPVKSGGGSGSLALMEAFQSAAGAFTSFTAGKAERTLAKAQKSIFRKQARRTEKLGQQAEARTRQKGKKTVGAQRAALAAQGIRLDVGSARDIQQETQDITELDALTVRNNAAREALGFRTQAIATGARGQIAYQKGIGQAGQSLLTGGLRAYSRWKGTE